MFFWVFSYRFLAVVVCSSFDASILVVFLSSRFVTTIHHAHLKSVSVHSLI